MTGYSSSVAKPLGRKADVVLAMPDATGTVRAGADAVISSTTPIADIMTWRDRIYAERGGGLLQLSAGSCIAEQTLLLDRPVDIQGVGSGNWMSPAPYAQNSTYIAATTGRDFNMVEVNMAYNVEHITLANLCIGNGIAGNYDAIVIAQTANKQTQNVNLSNLRWSCSGARHGLVITPDVAAQVLYRIVVDNCISEDCTGGDGIHIDASTAAVQHVYINNFRDRNDKRSIYATGDVRDLQVFGGQIAPNEEGVYLDTISTVGNIEFISLLSLGAAAPTKPLYYLTGVDGAKFIGGGHWNGGNGRVYGFQAVLSDYLTIDGLMLNGHLEGGIRLEGCQWAGIHNVMLRNNCQTADNTYAEIAMVSSGATHCKYNVIRGARIYETAANKAKYGISEADANQDYNTWDGTTYGCQTSHSLRSGAHSAFALMI